MNFYSLLAGQYQQKLAGTRVIKGARFSQDLDHCDNCTAELGGHIQICVMKPTSPQQRFRHIYLLCKKCAELHAEYEEFYIVLRP